MQLDNYEVIYADHGENVEKKVHTSNYPLHTGKSRK